MRITKTFSLVIGLIVIGLVIGITYAAEKTAAENYKQHCVKCHGEQGKGDGPATKTIKAMKMADWSSKEAMDKFKDEDLTKIIKQGGAAVNKSKIMPAYKEKMQDGEIKDMLSYIHSLAK
ncbi:MAG: cytochrome c [Acidobacteria bacterium]|nr:cytochrome c [Acidobacteriota bacterium]MBI3655613.1 cytochrome c [Acidobacteriota bacterium]